MAIRDIVPFSRRGQYRGGTPVRRWDNPLAKMHEELDRMFEDFLPAGFRGTRGFPEFAGEGGYLPNVDVKETDKEIRVSAELPGVDEKDIEVRLDNDTLVISGQKSEEKEDRDGDIYRRECFYGSFYRTIPLTAEVDMENAKATYKKGVLKLKLPKTGRETDKGRKIEVKGA